jgi:NAD(P)-dependent dehydrogenase (short-subunit alcohol dehydrogenase family)
MKRLEGKVAVITGAALGIGKASSLLFAKQGAKVAVTDILDIEGQKLAEQIRLSGGDAEFWHLDTKDEQQVTDVINSIASKYGKINILVNNAGISGTNKPTHEISAQEWDRVMNVNVKGVFLCTKYCIPYLIVAGGGSIINLSSIYGIISAQDVPPYHASKGAVRLMSKTDALLYAKYKIRVNSVHPGFIWTPMVEKFAESVGNPEEVKKTLGELHPLGHVGDADDVAYGLLYLASDEAKFVTGSELVIDGGYTAR